MEYYTLAKRSTGILNKIDETHKNIKRMKLVTEYMHGMNLYNCKYIFFQAEQIHSQRSQNNGYLCADGLVRGTCGLCLVNVPNLILGHS